MNESKLPKRSLAALLTLGVASGLPFDLAHGTLQSWVTDAAPGLSLRDIGTYSLIGLPYVFKPLWSPLLDRFSPPGPLKRLGHRKGWAALAQLLCGLALLALAFTSPSASPLALGIFALLLASASATQDIAVDAWRTEVLPTASRGLGAALAAWGYRLGIMLGGVLVPLLAVRAGLGWDIAYGAMGLLMLLAPLSLAIAPPEETRPRPQRLVDAVVEPFRELWRRPYALTLIAVVMSYKLGDAFGSSLFTAFLQRGLGFAPDEVAALRKSVGVLASLGGMALGGLLMVRLRLVTALWVFGLLQAVTNLLFVWLADTWQDYTALSIALILENLAGGLGSVALVALITSLCDLRFSATQYALLSALAALGSKLVGPFAGELADQIGWSAFFLCSFVISLPTLLLIGWRRQALTALH